MGLYNLFFVACFMFPVLFYLASREKKPLSAINLVKILLLVALTACTLYPFDSGFRGTLYVVIMIFALPVLLIPHWVLWIIHGFRRKGVSLAAELFLPIELLLLVICMERYLLAGLFGSYLFFLIVAHIWEKRKQKSLSIPLPESEAT